MMGRQVFYIANLFYNPNWPLQSKVLQVSDEKTSPNWYLAIIILVSASEKFMESYLLNISLANFISVPIIDKVFEKKYPQYLGRKEFNYHVIWFTDKISTLVGTHFLNIIYGKLPLCWT